MRRFESFDPKQADHCRTTSGHARHQLKTPYRDGITHILMEPLDLMVRLAALVPPPRMHLARYHGVFAPQRIGPVTDSVKPPTARHMAMNWAPGLRRVFGIEIEDCARCDGKLWIIVSIAEPEVVAKILAHLEKTAPDQHQSELPLGARAPPSQVRLL